MLASMLTDHPGLLLEFWALAWCWFTGRSLDSMTEGLGGEIDALKSRIEALEAKLRERDDYFIR
jgi:hypothetical protein